MYSRDIVLFFGPSQLAGGGNTARDSEPTPGDRYTAPMSTCYHPPEIPHDKISNLESVSDAESPRSQSTHFAHSGAKPMITVPECLH